MNFNNAIFRRSLILLFLVSECYFETRNIETCKEPEETLSNSFQKELHRVQTYFEQLFNSTIVEKRFASNLFKGGCFVSLAELNELVDKYLVHLPMFKKDEIYNRYLGSLGATHFIGLIDLQLRSIGKHEFYLSKPKSYFKESSFIELRILTKLDKMIEEIPGSVQQFYPRCSGQILKSMILDLDRDWKQYQANMTDKTLQSKLHSVLHTLRFKCSTLKMHASSLLERQSQFISLQTQLKVLQTKALFELLGEQFEEYFTRLAADRGNSTLENKPLPIFLGPQNLAVPECFESKPRHFGNNLLTMLTRFFNTYNSSVVHKQPGFDIKQQINEDLLELESLLRQNLINQLKQPADNLYLHYYLTQQAALMDAMFEIMDRVNGRMTFFQRQDKTYFEHLSSPVDLINQIPVDYMKEVQRILPGQCPLKQLDEKWQKLEHTESSTLRGILNDLRKVSTNFQKRVIKLQKKTGEPEPYLHHNLVSEFEFLHYEILYTKLEAFYNRYLQLLPNSTLPLTN